MLRKTTIIKLLLFATTTLLFLLNNFETNILLSCYFCTKHSRQKTFLFEIYNTIEIIVLCYCKFG